MKTSTKIIIVVLSVIVVGVWIYAIISINKFKKETWRGDNINMMQYFNDINETGNSSNSIEENNTIEDNTNTSVNTNSTNTSANITTGIEEQESKNENTELNNQNTAIDLAKKEWGLSTTSYTFDITKKISDGIYEVSIRNKTTTEELERYVVNVKTGAVKVAE